MLDMGFQDSVEEILASSYTAGQFYNFIECLVSSCSNTGSIRDDPYWTSRKNSFELIEPSSINKFSLVQVSFSGNAGSTEYDPFWASRKNSFELIGCSSVQTAQSTLQFAFPLDLCCVKQFKIWFLYFIFCFICRQCEEAANIIFLCNSSRLGNDNGTKIHDKGSTYC